MHLFSSIISAFTRSLRSGNQITKHEDVKKRATDRTFKQQINTKCQICDAHQPIPNPKCSSYFTSFFESARSLTSLRPDSVARLHSNWTSLFHVTLQFSITHCSHYKITDVNLLASNALSVVLEPP